jgi:hypothetical protein
MKTFIKAFNLEHARQGKSVQTVSGLSAEILYFNRKDPQNLYPLVVLVSNFKNNEIVKYYTNSGRLDADKESKFDLVMKPIIKTYYQNIYLKDDQVIISKDVYTSLDIAEQNVDRTMTFLKTVSFDVEV